jgi:hypothetical protein
MLIGIFYVGVCFGTDAVPILKNFRPSGESTKPVGITDLTWTDLEERKELIVTFANGIVKNYNTKLKAFTQEMDLALGSSRVVSLKQYER